MRTGRPRYLRLSVTARCGLHCLYCRPAGSASSIPAPELTVGQLRLLVECAAAEGVRKVRITGGEPLVRDDLEEIVEAVTSVPDIRETVMTTNGLSLKERSLALRRAGLQRVNVSLDTLKPDRFRAMTGADFHGQVLEGIIGAVEVFPVVKVNVVLVRGWNEDEITDLVQFAGSTGVRVRFIERYNSGCGTVGVEGVPSSEVLERLEAAFGALLPLRRDPLSVEQAYRVPGAGGAIIGLIASASHPPCGECAKLRVTASARLLPCLFAETGVELAGFIEREDAAGLRRAIRTTFRCKTAGLAGAGVRGAVWEVGG